MAQVRCVICNHENDEWPENTCSACMRRMQDNQCVEREDMEKEKREEFLRFLTKNGLEAEKVVELGDTEGWIIREQFARDAKECCAEEVTPTWAQGGCL